GRMQDDQVARERAMRLGYDPGVVYRVLVMLADPDEERTETAALRQRLFENLSELAQHRSPQSFATVRDDELVVLVPDADGAADIGRTAIQAAAALLPDWRV